MADDPQADAPRAKGRATRRTDEEIRQAAAVTPDDEAPAKDRWHRDAPRRFRGLIDATLDDEE